MDSLSLAWTLRAEIPVPEDVAQLLVEGETAVAAFATVRDSAVFTTKRLIVRDVQGLSGKKIEIYSLPYEQILMWSSENAGTIDLNSELQLWTRVGSIKVKLAPAVDIRRLDALMAWALLGPSAAGMPFPVYVPVAAAPAIRLDDPAVALEYARWLDESKQRDSPAARADFLAR